MPVTTRTYEQLALEDPEGHWELDHGTPRRKPPMTMPHNDVMTALYDQLRPQIPRRAFRMRLNTGRTRTTESYYVPDVMVVPVEYGREFEGSRQLEAYTEPLPFVAEVWSPS